VLGASDAPTIFPGLLSQPLSLLAVTKPSWLYIIKPCPCLQRPCRASTWRERGYCISDRSALFPFERTVPEHRAVMHFRPAGSYPKYCMNAMPCNPLCTVRCGRERTKARGWSRCPARTWKRRSKRCSAQTRRRKLEWIAPQPGCCYITSKSPGLDLYAKHHKLHYARRREWSQIFQGHRLENARAARVCQRNVGSQGAVFRLAGP